MNRLAFVGIDRQVHLSDARGAPPVLLTPALPRPGGAWSMLKGPQDAWSWPTWSPTGEWLAAFAVETSDAQAGPSRVVALSLDGIGQEEWAQVAGAAPIYLQWHPSGGALTVLTQQNQELVLGVLRRDRLGQLRPVEHGVPLFFNWTRDGARLLLHVGGNEGEGRLLLRDPLGDGEDKLLDRAPGSFCAPVFAGGQAVYAASRRGEGASDVVASAPDGADARVLARRRGLLALVAGPGDRVALSAAPRGEGTPYRGIDLLDVRTGEVENLTESDCLAFFWAPSGDWILYARVDAEANCLTWYRAGLDGRLPVALGTFWPTRDLLFYLHFFDQYAGSHSLISADGRFVTFAGYPAGGGQADLSAPPRIWVKDVTEPDRPAFEVGRGSFSVFSPVA